MLVVVGAESPRMRRRARAAWPIGQPRKPVLRGPRARPMLVVKVANAGRAAWRIGSGQRKLGEPLLKIDRSASGLPWQARRGFARGCLLWPAAVVSVSIVSRRSTLSNVASTARARASLTRKKAPRFSTHKPIRNQVFQSIDRPFDQSVFFFFALLYWNTNRPLLNWQPPPPIVVLAHSRTVPRRPHPYVICTRGPSFM